MHLSALTLLLKNASQSGAQNALDANGMTEAKVTKSEAYRQFGRSNVDRWIQEGLLPLHSADGKILHKCIDRSKLEAIAHSSNRITYLPVAER